MDGIGLEAAIAALRAELLGSHRQAGDHGLAFPVERVELEFQVGVTRDANARSGVRFWLVELGGDAHIGHEQVQRLTVTLGPPQLGGETVSVSRGLDYRP